MIRETLKDEYLSWGRYPRPLNQFVTDISRSNPSFVVFDKYLYLPRGLGRSYGDSCLNDGNVLVTTRNLSHFMSFDENNGYLKAEAGISLDDILKVFVPKGWFLPVTPGTRFVTLGGAIANDVHGKNHHIKGSFGNYVHGFELLRSNGNKLECTPDQNSELYKATIGGLGLTGLITWAYLKLRKIENAYIESESITFANIDEFFEISEQSEGYEFSVSWVDCLSTGSSLGRGIFMRGNFSEDSKLGKKTRKGLSLGVPFNAPDFLLNPYTMRLFNTLYYNKQRNKFVKKLVHYEPFFYPLDTINNWNRLYGFKGFLQWQCVVPFTDNRQAIKVILEKISASGAGSFLAVLKTFGDIPSPGLLSFPRKGVTLALDFPNSGEKTYSLLNELDRIVRSAGGAFYPAKDARMHVSTFKSSFPNLKIFEKSIDPKFSSSFWRRMQKEAPI